MRQAGDDRRHSSRRLYDRRQREKDFLEARAGYCERLCMRLTVEECEALAARLTPPEQCRDCPGELIERRGRDRRSGKDRRA